MKLKTAAVYSLFLLFSFAGFGQIDLASQRYLIEANGSVCLFPYISSHELDEKNEKIERLIYAIHSSSYDAYMYYDNSRRAIARAQEAPEKNLIVAPHFLSRSAIYHDISTDMPADTLYWRGYPFWGASEAVYNGRSISVSSYDVVDQMLENIVAGGNFPNLKSIVILGHSAGGQMVNRYAAGSRFEFDCARPNGIEVKYLVMAPSTCVYFTPERLTSAGNEFCVPTRMPSDFNSWGYGLDKLYTYHRQNKVTAEWIRDHYSQRNILYLVGERDIDPHDKSLAISPGAMLMGRNRLERAEIYIRYLQHLYGSGINMSQRFEPVPFAGHSGRELMTSRFGLDFIFAGSALTASNVDAEENADEIADNEADGGNT